MSPQRTSNAVDGAVFSRPSDAPNARTRVGWLLVAGVAVLGLALLGWGAAALGTSLAPTADPLPQSPEAEALPPGPLTASASTTPAAASSSTVPPSAVVTDSAPPAAPPAFSADNAMRHVRVLAKIGVRREGTKGEREAAEYIQGELDSLGYRSRIQEFMLPDGTKSRNVIARAQGARDKVIVLGAHMDTKRPSPGANDNGTGCAALIEIARVLASSPVTASIEFVFFGAEEMIDRNPDHHHFGSRHYVKTLSPSERELIAGMISVDMIGYGPDFVVRSMKRGPQDMVKLIRSQAKKADISIAYLADPSKVGWSDHEPFQRAGIPAAWIEWRPDPAYHTKSDTADRVKPSKVRTAGRLTLSTIRGLSDNKLDSLAAH